jgi:hypothetical protein
MSDDVEIGYRDTIYEGPMRRHVGRQIGFLATWENRVPKVNGKHFPYTKAGKAAAKKAMTKKKAMKKLKEAR